jgi:hypothetical protein
MAMVRMVKHVDGTRWEFGLCPPSGLCGQSAQIACCGWMQHRFEAATPAQPAFLLQRRAFGGLLIEIIIYKTEVVRQWLFVVAG